MNAIDPYVLIAAQQNALLPETAVLDARTEIDRLGFLSDFAALINFYDSDNRVNGNWAPFLLKDPAILMAHIARTNLNRFHFSYKNTCKFIEAGSLNHSEMAGAMNRLFDQITHLFMRLEQWTHYMQSSDAHYEMKTYLLHQVKHHYSAIFWAVVGLRDNLSALPHRYKVEPAKHYLFDDFDQHIWKQNADKRPFWDILNLAHPLTQNSPWQIYHVVKKNGDEVLSFFTSVIAQAAMAYDQVKLQKSKFPDTLLLRAFTNILQIHQQQLNEVTAKHLSFYFQDVLKQSPRGGVADKAYIQLTAAKKDAAFLLPGGTLFDAGLDEQKKPIQFSCDEPVSVNPAVISAAYTLLAVPNATGHTLHIGEIITPEIIKTDENGRTQSVNTFGSTKDDSTLNGAILSKSGLAFSSPLLFLQEGERTIKLSFSCEEIDPGFFADASFYLSTAKSWVDITNCILLDVNPSIGFEYQRSFTLPATVAPIVPFAKNPENIDATYPVLKIEFNTLTLPPKLPRVKFIKLSVTAKGINNFNLYNDYGGISAKTPFQPFGATPLRHSSFIIGSPELFSKPLDSFNLTLKWNNLPLAKCNNFDEYYRQYNHYLHHDFEQYPSQKKCCFFLRRLFRRSRSADAVTTYLRRDVFHNHSFIADFKMLQAGAWADLNVFNLDNDQQTAEGEVPTRYLFHEDQYNQLNTISKFKCKGPVLTKDDPIAVTPYEPDPSIQNDSSYKFSDTSTSGFIKIVLDGNPYGFGSQLYGSVVAQIATYNAWRLYHDPKVPLNQLATGANLPFVPRLTTISADYGATAQETCLPACFFYSPFSLQPARCDALLTKEETDQRQYPWLFPSLKQTIDKTGVLLLALDNLAPAESVSLYLELSDATHASAKKNKLKFFYQSSKGWQPLTLLSDGTGGFSHSGILKINIPQDAIPEDFLTVKGKYAIAITVSGEPETAAKLIALWMNGLLVTRAGAVSGKPSLSAGLIKKTVTAMPLIAAVSQPFPSFGGAAAETPCVMQQRVTSQLKTKDRAISREDYTRLICAKFPDVYYASLTCRPSKSHRSLIHIFVAGVKLSETTAAAFQPTINPARLQEIADFLTLRSSGTSTIRVSNFHITPVTVKANILIKAGFFPDGVGKSIIDAIDLYLAPWIVGGPQPAVLRDLSVSPLVSLIKSINGVAEVEQAEITPKKTENTITVPLLYVTSGKHQIFCHGNAA